MNTTHRSVISITRIATALRKTTTASCSPAARPTTWSKTTSHDSWTSPSSSTIREGATSSVTTTRIIPGRATGTTTTVFKNRASIVTAPTVIPVAATRLSAAFVFVIRSGDRSTNRVPLVVVPRRRLTMTPPTTSVCPVAVTVFGKPKASKIPCAERRPGTSKKRNTRRPISLDFILVL